MVEPIRTAGRDVHRRNVAEKLQKVLRYLLKLQKIQTTMAARIEKASANIDAAISSVLSNRPNILSFKERQRTVFPFASLSSASRIGSDVSG